MTPETAARKSGRIFYGWFALAGNLLVVFVVGGVFFNSFGVLLPVVSQEFEWSRAVVAGALSAGVIAFGLPSPLYGILIARLGPRFSLIWGNLLVGLGIAAISLVQEVWHLYFLYIIIGMGAGFGGYVSSTMVINNWFIKKRSLALGLFVSSGGLGGFVFPPIATALISALDWRMAWLVLSGFIIIVGVILGGVVLVRNRPEDVGQVPDGMPADVYTEIEKAESQKDAGAGTGEWSIRKVLKSPTFWLIGGFTSANTFSMGMVTTHQIAYLRDINYSPMTAATTMSFMSIFIIIGGLLFGALAMKFKARYLAVIFFAIQVSGLVILMTSRELGLIYVYAAFQGISNGALNTVMPTIVGAYFPRRRFAHIVGMLLPFQVCANAFGTLVAGAIFDATSTYIPAFLTAAVFSLTGLVFVLITRRPKPA
jgi:MFS family permease